MAVPGARVHLKVAHAALSALLLTPPKCNMLPLLPTPPCAAAILPIAKPLANKPSHTDTDERWDTRKTKKVTSPPPMPGRADFVERWDTHKNNKQTTILDSSSSSSSSGMSSSLVRSSKCPISRASTAKRWDVQKKRRPPQPQAEPLDDGESSSTGSDHDVDTEEEEEEEEILWKPRAMYAGLGFTITTLEPTILPMPTVFLVIPVA